jgi:hypothetical protein
MLIAGARGCRRTTLYTIRILCEAINILRGNDLRQMGCCASAAQPAKGDGQYESLMITKPPPITLAEIQSEGIGKMDVPLFAEVSDGEDPIVSDPETLTDEELNRYGSKLSGSD